MKNKILKIFFQILGKIANNYIKRHKPEIIGITGSVGKTSTRMIVFEILKNTLKDKKIYTSPKNFNGEFGLSLSILGIEKYKPSILNIIIILIKGFAIGYFGKKKYDIILLEYGIDHIGEMDFLLKIAKPTISIFTKIDKVHCLEFGDPQTTATEKFKLIQNTKSITFLNYDDSYARSGFDDINIDKFYYSTSNNNNNENIDINTVNFDFEINENKIYTTFDTCLKSGNCTKVKTNLLNYESSGYIGVGLVIAEILNNKYENKYEIFNKDGGYFELIVKLQAGRMNIFDGIKESIIIDSSYNGAPESIKSMINNTIKINKKLFFDYKIILFLGDMRELGEFAEKEHRKLAGIISQSCEYVFLVGENMGKFCKDELIKIGFDENNIFHSLSSKKNGIILRDLLNKSNEKYIILFKGSQNTIFIEEGIKPILKNILDIKKLPRQDNWWLKKKEEYYNSI